MQANGILSIGRIDCSVNCFALYQLVHKLFTLQKLVNAQQLVEVEFSYENSKRYLLAFIIQN